MFPKLLLLAASLVSQFTVVVRTPDGVATYNERQTEQIPIVMPTERWQCVRMPAQWSGDRVMILVSCAEHGKPAAIVGTSCSTKSPEEHESMMTLNAAEGDDEPLPVTIMAGCRTVATNKTYL